MICADPNRKEKTLNECVESLECLLKNTKSSDYNYQLTVKDSPFNLIKNKYASAFDIIDKKAVNVNRVKQIIAKGLPWHTYNLIQDANRHLTKEEFEILRKALS